MPWRPLPHPHWSEAVTAFVLLKPGVSASAADIITHCRAHLGGFEVPKSIQFVDSFPMTSTGKVQKHELRTRFRDLYADAGGDD